MWTSDEAVLSVMLAAQAEALRLHAPACGSEHVLLGLLTVRDAVTHELLTDESELTVEAVRQAIVDAVDDAPHLQRLGIDLDAVVRAEQASPAAVRTNLQNRHTAEFQAALDQSTLKWSDLIKRKQLPRAERATATSLCWLLVLEPSARAHRLLQVLGVDPDRLRTAVLADMADPDSQPPVWPTHVRPGLLDKLHSRFAERVYVAK